MKTAMVRYRVKAECAAENEQAIVEVFAQLHRDRPQGLRYASFKLDDGVSFVHIVSFEGAGRSALMELPAFRAFIAGVKQRCEQQPVSVDMNPVGSYAADAAAAPLNEAASAEQAYE
ncbi:MAG: hypothetical protein JWR16_2847 [Nevskia sp.]|nr:hypothetical protein [Nevskia sp.]